MVAVAGPQITVAGDATGVASVGSVFMITPPPGVDMFTRAEETNPLAANSRYLWAGGFYFPPQVGVLTTPPGGGLLGIYGRQPGSNLDSTYYFWNRVYDPHMGRWTTPDPAAKPWTNLQSYVSESPIGRSDLAGLNGLRPHLSGTPEDRKIVYVTPWDSDLPKKTSASAEPTLVLHGTADLELEITWTEVVPPCSEGGRPHIRDLKMPYGPADNWFEYYFMGPIGLIEALGGFGPVKGAAKLADKAKVPIPAINTLEMQWDVKIAAEHMHTTECTDEKGRKGVQHTYKARIALVYTPEFLTAGAGKAKPPGVKGYEKEVDSFWIEVPGPCCPSKCEDSEDVEEDH